MKANPIQKNISSSDLDEYMDEFNHSVKSVGSYVGYIKEVTQVCAKTIVDVKKWVKGYRAFMKYMIDSSIAYVLEVKKFFQKYGIADDEFEGMFAQLNQKSMGALDIESMKRLKALIDKDS